MRLQAGRCRGATFCFGGLQKAKYGPALGVGAKGTAARLGIGVDATGAGPVGGRTQRTAVTGQRYGIWGGGTTGWRTPQWPAQGCVVWV